MASSRFACDTFVRAIALASFAGACGCGVAAVSRPEPSPGPEPARLEVRAPDGAQVHMDSVLVGTAPLPAPIDAEPGEHRLTVSRNGYEPYVETVRLERGTTAHLKIELEETTQRNVAWAAIGLGGASVAVGVAFGVASIVEHRAAVELLSGPVEELDGDDIARYDELIAARDDYRLLSGITAGIGLAGFVAGSVLFAFDAPAPEITVVPVVGTGQAGVHGAVRF